MKKNTRDNIIVAVELSLIFSFIPLILGYLVSPLIVKLQWSKVYFWLILSIVYICVAFIVFYRSLKEDDIKRAEHLRLRAAELGKRLEENRIKWAIEKRKEDERKQNERRERETRLKKAEFLITLNPKEFEHEIMQLYKKLGYAVKITPYTNDKGVDGIAIKERVKFAIQCKRYNNLRSIGRPDLQKFYGAMSCVRANRGIFVATCKFTDNAKEFASKHRIECIDLERLIEIVNQVY